MSRDIPGDLVDEPMTLQLGEAELRALDAVKSEVLDDMRFEHMEQQVDRAIWRFVCQCYIDRMADFVWSFVREHAREPVYVVCYVPVESLRVDSEKEVLGLALLPIGDSRIPAPRWGFQLNDPIASVLAIPVSGTSYERMADRARASGRQMLRRLRIALREHRGLNDRQLRFRLGDTYSFGEQFSGWAAPAEMAYELEFTSDLLDLARSQAVADLPLAPATEVEQKADLALRWMERAWFATESLVALLYLFFALEALLGDKSEGLKAHGLAFRQTMLSHIMTGGFSHPNETWFLYDTVRSGAVHGEDAPEVSWDIVRGFARVVRRALNQYVSLARDQRLSRRGALLRVLDGHLDRPALIAWLRQNGGPIWTEYLDRTEGPGGDANSSD